MRAETKGLSIFVFIPAGGWRAPGRAGEKKATKGLESGEGRKERRVGGEKKHGTVAQ